MPAFPITEAQVTGLFVESVFFGIHLITFGSCMQALMPATDKQWRGLGNVNWAMLVVSLFLLANAAFDVSLGFYHNLKAFVFFKGSGGPVQELTNISDWINVSKVRSTSRSAYWKLIVRHTSHWRWLFKPWLVMRCWYVGSCRRTYSTFLDLIFSSPYLCVDLPMLGYIRRLVACCCIFHLIMGWMLCIYSVGNLFGGDSPFKGARKRQATSACRNDVLGIDNFPQYNYNR